MHVQLVIVSFSRFGLSLVRFVKLYLLVKVNICHMSRSKWKPGCKGLNSLESYEK